MLKFFFNGSQNPTKVALLLEELGLPYEPIPIDTRKGDQFAPDFLALNPNGKVPVLVDDPDVIFDSNLSVQAWIGRGGFEQTSTHPVTPHGGKRC